MRFLKSAFVAASTVALTLALATPALAMTHTQTDFKDGYVSYNTVTRILEVCDHSPGNGTALGKLEVIGGNTWSLFDSNGEQGLCESAGPLSVDTTKMGRIVICWNSSGGCFNSDKFPL